MRKIFYLFVMLLLIQVSMVSQTIKHNQIMQEVEAVDINQQIMPLAPTNNVRNSVLAPLSGLYTIGSGGNYDKLSTAVNDLILQGVSGPVTFEFTDANYTDTSVVISGFVGQGAANPVIFRKAAAVPSVKIFFTGGQTTRTWGVRLDSTSYVSFIGSTTVGQRPITFEVDTTAGNATRNVFLIVRSNNVRLEGLELIGYRNSSTAVTILNQTAVSGSTLPNSNITFTNLLLKRGSTCIGANGISNALRDNNVTISFCDFGGDIYVETFSSRGISTFAVDNMTIYKNDIRRGKNFAAATTGPAGIIVFGGFNNLVISHNIIHDLEKFGTLGGNATGIRLQTNGPGVYTNTKIYNNMVYDLRNPSGVNATAVQAIEGIVVSSTSPNPFNVAEVYNNTIHLTGSLSATTQSYTAGMLFSTTLAADTVKVFNNIISNETVAPLNGSVIYADFIHGSTSGGIGNRRQLSDNNVYWYPDVNGAINLYSLDFADWQTTTFQDANSIDQVNPGFISSTDPHININAAAHPANGNAIPISYITNDIDLQARQPVLPDIGADEYGELFYDNFDSYISGQRLASQSSNWTTWSGLPGSTEDPFVSNTFAFSLPNSVKIVPLNDCVRAHGNKTTGKWYISFMMYIPAGKAGYFNTLNTFPTPGTSSHFAMEVYFDAGGAGELSNGSAIPFTYQVGQWNQVMVVVDLDSPTHQAEFWIGTGNLTQIATWDWTRGGTTYANRISANDFFGPTQTAADEMYIDNFYFSNIMPPISQLANDVGTVSIDLASQIGPGSMAPMATVKNYGTAANTFDVKMTITGGYTSTKTVTGLVSGATQQVTFDNWNPTTAGLYTVNVNTVLLTDLNTSNDSLVKNVYVWDASGDWTSGVNNPDTTYNGSGVGYTNGAEKYLFSMGGNTANTLGTACYKYNVVTNTWSPIAPFPEKRIVFASAVVGNFVYAIGGSDGTTYKSTVYRYDIAGNTWSLVAPLPITIGWGRAVAYNNNYIYIAGGLDAATSGNYLSSVYVYNVTTNTWATATSMPGAVFGGGFSIAGNKLVYAAGATTTGISNTVYVGTIDAGNPALIAWTTMTNPYPGIKDQVFAGKNDDLAVIMVNQKQVKGRGNITEAVNYPPGSMYRIHAAPWGSDGIIIAGGSPTSDWIAANPNPCYVYKPATDTWIAQENVPIPVTAAHLGSVYDGSTWKLIVAGGINNLGAVTTATQIYTQTLAAATFALSVNVTAGWNMVSVPGVNPAGQGVSTWWPNRNLLADVYKWNGSYSVVTNTTPGEGYWMLHTGAQTYNYPAIQIVNHDPIPLTTGWNMIGGYENTPLVSGLTTTPPGLIVAGTVYGWTGSYTNATNLVPGYGYWVLSTGNGSINPPTMAAGSSKIAEQDKSEWGKITLTDASGKSYTLYAANGEVNLNQYSMPPLPPAGMFDVRYSSNRKAEDLKSGNQTIEMRGLEYPVTVRVEKMGIKLQDETGKIVSERLKAGEEVVISNSAVSKLMVTSEVIPEVYSLEQNYPNPFNPSTKIEFSIPEDVNNVTLTIYNALGQKVAELVNSKMEAGKYSYVWNASDVSTGLYIYELRTDKFVSVKKMMLLK